MEETMDPAVNNHISRDLRNGLETMIRLVRSLAEDDQELLQIQASNSWCSLDRVSTYLHNIKISKERIQQVLAVHMKWAKDESIAIKKKIVTLDSSVSVAREEQTEIEAQEEHSQQLLDKYSKDLQQAEEQLKRKEAQNWRIFKLFTNAFANSEAEARKSYQQMEHHTALHASRHHATLMKGEKSMESIAVMRSKHDHLVSTVLCEKLDEISQLNTCFKGEKSQSEKTMKQAAILDPITIYCHVLCEVCQQLSVDPMIIQPILEELRSSLQRCFSTEAAGLPLVQKEIENLHILSSTVESLEISKCIPSLGFDDGIFSEVELSVVDVADHLRITSGTEEPEVSLEGAYAMSQGQVGTSLALSGAVSRGLSHDLDPQDKLVVPESKQMKNIQTRIRNMQGLNLGDDTDFSLSEFPPKDGFDHLHWSSSFQASIIQLQSAWWACLVATRNSFLMFQLYTRLIAVCLIQTDQTLQMASADDLAMYLNKTVPVLEKILQQTKDIAGQLDSNFTSINGILSEMTETCTVFGGKSRTSQGELSTTQKVNLTESEATQEQIKEMIEERKMIADSVEKAEEEFSKVVLGLPGILDLLGTTAVERCLVVLNVASRFFRKITEKLVRRDTKGCFRVLYKELTIIKEIMYDFFSRDTVDDFEEERMFQDWETKNDKENSKDLVMSIKIMQIKTAIDLMIQMLLEQGTLGVPSTRDVVWETQARLDVNMRTLKKITGDYANFQELVFSLSDVCQTILDESRSMHPSEETYQKVIDDLLQAQDTLDVILKTIKSKLDAILSKQKVTTAAKIPQKNNYKGYLILEYIAEGRFTKGKELHSLWRRYDRHTENISFHFESQKETAETLSRLNMEMNALERKLDLMAEANRDLTSLQRDIQTISNFGQQVSNAIETKLCPKTFKLIQQMRRCLATLRRTENERVSGLQQEMIQKEIREVGCTAERIYKASKNFLKHSDTKE